MPLLMAATLVLVLVAPVSAAGAFMSSQGGRSAAHDGNARAPVLAARPVESDPPTSEQVRDRMLAIFESEEIGKVSIREDGASHPIEWCGRDAEAWTLLAEGIRTSKPGPPVPDLRGICFRIREEMTGGGSETSRIFLGRGILFSHDPWLGGSLLTLRVGPEFGEGIRLLSERIGVRAPELMVAASDSGHLGSESHQLGSATLSEEATGAVAIAQRFARKYGLPLGADPGVEAIRVDGRARWIIRNGRLAWVLVDAADEHIVEAYNGVARLRIKGWPKTAALSRDEARAQGGQVLEAMGIDGATMSFTEAHLSGYEEGGGGGWSIYWERTLAGIPVKHQYATVSLDPADGQLLTARTYLKDLPHEPADVLLGGDRAAGFALALARELFVTEEARVEGAPRLLYVQRNYDAETRRHIDPPDDRLRPAWEVIINPPVEVRMGARATMWIDAQTGELLGGYDVPDSAQVERRTAIVEGRKPGPAGRRERRPPHLALIAGAAGVIVIVLAILYWPRPARLTLADAGESGQPSESGAGEDGADT